MHRKGIKKGTIPSPPRSLNWSPLGGRWFHWSEIDPFLRPGSQTRRSSLQTDLSEILDYGGVYVLAWADQEPTRELLPWAAEVKYVGETHWFKARMTGFGWSAGFWGGRYNGHSAAWRWPKGKRRKLWVAFFDVARGQTLGAHLARGLRCWVEGVALEEHLLVNGSLPALNEARRNTIIKL
jgi:hypothetical protein